MKARIVTLLGSLLLLTSCMCNRLWVQSLYINYQDLASAKVGTPDPRKECPDIGQRLLVCWSLSADTMKAQEISLSLRVRYGDQTEREIVRPICKANGSLLYDLWNDEYLERCGILAYCATIVADGCVVEEWVHHIWTERIEFEE